ncbi:flagellar protein FlaJ [Candidatus Methanophagaceae archaeon]|nr:flagellar protein FlaJ [Methanophagales archaeon]
MSSGNMNIEGIAVRIFGNFFLQRKAKFSSLSEDLLKARLYTTSDKWLSKAAFYAIIAVSCVVGMYIMFRLILSPVLDLGPFGLMDVVFIVSSSLVSFVVTFFAYFSYPKILAWERGSKIDKTLPYAIGYISAMASVGVIPYKIFKKLSEAEETYGEVSNEMKLLVRDVELLGWDFMAALKKLAAVTPSANMRTMLQGAITTALSGGEMGDYFVNAAREYMGERRAIYESLIETQGLFAEVYVIGIVVAPLLLVVVISIMCYLGSATLEVLAVITYLVIPLGTVTFIILIGMVSED